MIKNFPKASLLYWSSVYSKGTPRIVFLGRLFTQIFTKSNYEHVAVCLQCTKAFSGEVVTDCTGSTLLQEGRYYVFEVNRKYGVIITSLESSIAQLYEKKADWSGKVFIQELNTNESLNYHGAFQDGINLLGQQYNTVWAIFSALDGWKIVKWFLKTFKIKPHLNHENFCSAFARINYQILTEKPINKDIAIRTTPEELRKSIVEDGFSDEKKLIEVQNGKCFTFNSEYFTP